MKRNLTAAIAALIIFFSGQLFAQQGVGVDVANPLEKLDVNGAIKIGTDINNSNAAPSGGAGTIRFRAGQFEGWDGGSWIPLGGGGGGTSPFILNGNLVQPDNTVVNLATDDFIFGSPSLADDGDNDHDGRFFYDKSKGAFRAGLVTGDQWDDIKRGNQSFAVGYDVTASGDYSMTLGEKSRATGLNAIALGRKAYAYGDRSFAWGNDVLASGEGAVAFGQLSTATADFSYASGNQANASGEYSVAIGVDASASNYASFAIGEGVIASGQSSIAIGNGSTASGLKSVAAGWDNTASGQQSMALGHSSTASGRYAVALGVDLMASGRSSMAMGTWNVAPSAYELAVGRYNSIYTPASTTDWQGADRLFTIGNGTGDLSRSNALTVLKNGNTGVGTSTPTATLHIDGTLRYVDGNQQAGFIPVSDANGTMTWTDPNSITTATDEDWSVNGNDQYSAVSGNVGIGTSAPTAKFHVKAVTNDENGGLKISNTNATAAIYLNAGNDLVIRKLLHPDQLVIDDGGNVGMGTATPEALLHLSSGTTGDASGIKLTQGSSNSLIYHNADSDLILQKAAHTNQLVLNSSGSIGIGTDAPSSRLHVEGSIRMVDGNEQTGYIPVASANGTMVWTDPTTITTASDADGDATNELQTLSQAGTNVTLSDGGGTISVADNDNDDTNEFQTISISGSDITLSDGGGTVSIPNDGDWTVSGNDQYSAVSGNVGIGTATPDARFHVSSTTTGDATGLKVTQGSSNSLIYHNADSDLILQKAAHTNQFVLNSSGSIGIGTDAPSSRLHVEGSIRMVDGNQQAGRIPVSSANGTMVWTDPTTITTASDADGDATNELQTLSQSGTDVTLSDGGGTISIADNDNDATNEYNTGVALSGTELQITDGGGTQTVDLASLVTDADWTISGNDQYSAVSGKVGIGTTTPDNKLQVVGSAAIGADTHTNTGPNSLVVGTNISNTGQNSIIGGNSHTVTGTHVLVSGYDHTVAADNSVVLNNDNSNTAAATNSLVGGYNSSVSGQYALSFGWNSQASGVASTSLGYSNQATGAYSFAGNTTNVVSGNRATGFGNNNRARSYGEFVVGSFNTDYTPVSATAINANDRVFTVGNGISDLIRSNAMVILKNGNTGIGVSTPLDKLHVDGNIRMVDGNQLAGRIPVSDANGTMTWTDPATITTADDGDWTVNGTDIHNGNTGNVGVGTATPSVALHVSANSTTGQFLVTPTATVAQDATTIIRGARNTTAPSTPSRLRFENYHSNSTTTKVFGAINGVLTDGTNNLGDLNIQTSADGTTLTEAVRIRKDGNVGIGATSPAEKLHVAGSIRMVDGNQLAGRIPVSDANGTMTWTDPATITTASDADGDATNELQTLSQSGTDVTLSDGGGTISVADNDNDATNEYNTGAALSGTELQITDGGGTQTVDLASLVTDADWTISGNDQYSAVSGKVGIGTSTPDNKLQVVGNAVIGADGQTNTGGNSLVVGIGNSNTGQNSMISGNSHTVTGTHVLTSGYNHTVAANSSVALNSDNNITSAATYSLVGGYNSEVSALYGLAFGLDNVASGQAATSLGRNNTASGQYSFAANASNIASGTRSAAFGQQDTVSGENSFATGWSNVVSGDNSFASGYDNNVSANYSLVTGVQHQLTGANLLASGDENTLTGSNSFSSGTENTVSSNAAAAIGRSLVTRSFGEVVVGLYNGDYTATGTNTFDGDDRVFVVGNGTSDANRSNAMTILKNGNVGIGADVPDTKLHVSSALTGDATGIKLTQGSANSLIYHNSDNDLIIRKEANANQLVIDNGGNIGIGIASPTEKLQVIGSIRMVDGNQGAGKVVVSEANGTMTWTDRSNFIAYHKQAGVLTVSDGSSTAYQNIAGLTSTTLDVQSGDVITLRAEAIVRCTSGSGNDDFYMRVTYGNCATGNSEEKIIRFDEDGGHDNATTLNYLDVITAPCTGTLWFRFQIKHVGDDPWEAVDGVIIAEKY